MRGRRRRHGGGDRRWNCAISTALPVEWCANSDCPTTRPAPRAQEVFLRALTGRHRRPGLTIFRAKRRCRTLRSANCIRSRRTTAPFSPDRHFVAPATGSIARRLPASGCSGGEAGNGSARSRSAMCSRRQRLGEQKALHFVASMAAQERLLLDGLDALRNDGHPERLAHADDRLGNGLILGIDRQIAHEGTIDLDGVDRETASSATSTNSRFRNRRSQGECRGSGSRRAP